MEKWEFGIYEARNIINGKTYPLAIFPMEYTSQWMPEVYRGRLEDNNLKTSDEKKDFISDTIMSKHDLVVVNEMKGENMFRWLRGKFIPYFNNYLKKDIKLLLHEHSLEIPFTQGLYNDVKLRVEAERSLSIDRFDRLSHLLNLKNCLVDLNSWEKDQWLIYKHDKTFLHYLTFNQLPIDYNDESKCPIITGFLLEMFEEHVGVIREFLGDVISGQIGFDKALIMHGQQDTGKTTLVDLIKAFLGLENYAGIKLQKLSDKFQTYSVKGKLLNIYDDLPTKSLGEIDAFKTIVTDRYLSGEAKHIQGDHTWVNTTKLLFTCNDLPKKPKSAEDEFWKRIILINAKNQIKEEDKDRNLLEKMTDKKEIEGLLMNILEGYKQLKKRGKYSDKYTNVEEIAMEWEQETSTLKDFIEECCESTEDKNDYINRDIFLEQFNKMRKERRLSTISVNKCTSDITNRLKYKKKILRNPYRVRYLGLKWKEGKEPEKKSLINHLIDKKVIEY